MDCRVNIPDGAWYSACTALHRGAGAVNNTGAMDVTQSERPKARPSATTN